MRFNRESKLFDAYDNFLGILADESLLENGRTQREHLEKLAVNELDTDPIFEKVRNISHQFRDAVHEIFLSANTDLSKLTIEYGVF